MKFKKIKLQEIDKLSFLSDLELLKDKYFFIEQIQKDFKEDYKEISFKIEENEVSLSINFKELKNEIKTILNNPTTKFKKGLNIYQLKI